MTILVRSIVELIFVFEIHAMGVKVYQNVGIKRSSSHRERIESSFEVISKSLFNLLYNFFADLMVPPDNV